MPKVAPGITQVATNPNGTSDYQIDPRKILTDNRRPERLARHCKAMQKWRENSNQSIIIVT